MLLAESNKRSKNKLDMMCRWGMNSGSYSYQGIILEKLRPDEIIQGFDCGDDDLNEYFACDSLDYRKELLTESYCFYRQAIGKAAVIALVDFCADAIPRENLTNSARRKINNAKRGFHSFPAVKITRLGVNKILQHHGIGSLLLDTIKHFFLQENKAGCRFLTVDAYMGAASFYEKNRFKKMLLNPETQENRHTVPMFFDLKELVKK